MGGTLSPCHPPPPKSPSCPPCSVTPLPWMAVPAWLLPVSPSCSKSALLHREAPPQAQQLSAGPEPPPPSPISMLTGHPSPAPPASVRPWKAALPPNRAHHLTGLQEHRLLGAVCFELDNSGHLFCTLEFKAQNCMCTPTVHSTHKNLMFMTLGLQME